MHKPRRWETSSELFITPLRVVSAHFYFIWGKVCLYTRQTSVTAHKNINDPEEIKIISTTFGYCYPESGGLLSPPFYSSHLELIWNHATQKESRKTYGAVQDGVVCCGFSANLSQIRQTLQVCECFTFQIHLESCRTVVQTSCKHLTKDGNTL